MAVWEAFVITFFLLQVLASAVKEKLDFLASLAFLALVIFFANFIGVIF